MKTIPAAITLSLVLLGCASSTVTFHATGMEPPLCRTGTAGTRTAVYWGTAWRADQKETARREDIAAKGIEDFFRSDPYCSVQTISRTLNGRDILLMSDKDILASSPHDVDKVHIIRLEELGPVFILYLSPILWTSDLNIQLRVRTLNARTGSLESDVTAHWRKGGPFNLRGTRGLSPDLAGFLHAIFYDQQAL